ncbi:serine/threonine-protein kinase [Kitasatospora sp. NPDC002040]|uniref:serine/threonine-protein kinase n=1 Tax=Kitasatospora sp. NPDC002040 TaxID=3154661 RepID=UPI00332C4EE1
MTERIGGGGMGDVWRADDQVLGRQVAVKVLHAALLEDEQFAERFRREARILAALSHPGIVDVHDYGESAEGSDDQGAYIVMELIDGQPLHQVLADGGPIPPGRALALLAGALDALHAAHQQDIVHRDIKPSNLMVRDGDRVTVTDFGIAQAAASTKLTASHAVLGTALYMAPEQAEGGAVTPLSDLYAIGVVCYELLTGEVPFGGESVFEIVLKHVREPAPGLPPAFPPAVRQFVATALAKQPGERYPDAAAMAAAARAAIAGGPATVPATVVPSPALLATPVTVVAGAAASSAPTVVQERRSRRSRFMVPLIIPIVITVGAGGAYLVDWHPQQGDANAAGGQPKTSVSGSPNPGSPSAAGAGSAPAASPAADGTSPAPGAPVTDPNAQPGTATGAQPGGTVPNPGGGAAAGGTGTGSTNNGGGSTNNGSGGTPGGGTPGGGGATNPAPTRTTAAPTTPPPAVPAGCGGSGWGYITGVASGLKLGLAGQSLAAGTKPVTGGYTGYGWARSAADPGGWYQFHPCSLSKPALVQKMMADGAVELAGDFEISTQWTVGSASTAGAQTLRDIQGATCLTDNGSGRAATMQTCTPGNKYQEWRVPKAG